MGVINMTYNNKAPCPCCGYMTIPNNGDALAYICPVCFWEIDFFVSSDDEPSGLNHGLSLNKARENYKLFKTISWELRKHCRPPNRNEYPAV